MYSVSVIINQTMFNPKMRNRSLRMYFITHVCFWQHARIFMTKRMDVAHTAIRASVPRNNASENNTVCEVNPNDMPKKSAIKARACANLDFHGMKCKNVEHAYGTTVQIINQNVLGCTRNHSDLLLYIKIGYPSKTKKQCNPPLMSGLDMVKSAYRLCLPSLRKSMIEVRPVARCGLERHL